MKIVLILFLFLISISQCQVLNVTWGLNVLFQPYVDNLQILTNWASDQSGPSWDDLQYASGQQLFIACLSALNSSFISIVAQAPFNNTLGLTVSSSGYAPNGNFFFRTPTSFGFSNESNVVTDCFTMTGNGICFNMFSNNATFSPGGYCGALEQNQQQPSVQFIIFSAPCLNSSVGDSCMIPGVGFCASNATCQANYLCNGTATINPAPVYTNASCWTPGECNPTTGVYPILNSTLYTPCVSGNPCFINEKCNGAQQCVNGSLSCAFSLTSCSGIPYCNVTTNYTCQYDPLPREGAVCFASGGFACRQNDYCHNGTCIYGEIIPPPTLDFYCSYPNSTCNNSTGLYDSWFQPNGTTCYGSDLCKIGQCALGLCGSYVSLNSTLGVISDCLAPACNSSSGEWYTVSGNNVGGSCQYPNVSAQNPCMVGICDSNDTCIFDTFYNCPRNQSLPCMNFTCNPFFPLNSQCQPIPILSGHCNIDECNLNGTCSFGVCVNTTIETCPNFQSYNTQCQFPSCRAGQGCYLDTFNNTTPCSNTCFVNGTGKCSAGICAIGIPTQACIAARSFATTLESFFF